MALSGFEAGLLLGACLLAAAVGMVALAAPPNTYDAMTYHMSRVAHWAQNQSVAHYPTSIIRQLVQPPWAEFAILHAYVLAGGDRLANMVQWFSMLGSAAGVSLVARRLGGSRRAQILAALVAVTIPMGVIQASGAKNDYVVAFWLTCLAALVLILDRRPAGSPVGGWSILAGGALGLALLTKATAYLFATPFAIWACAARVRRDGWGSAGRVAAGLLAMAALVNAGHLARNLERYGSPVGPIREGPFEYLNASLGVRSTLSLALRNAGLHLGTPWRAVNAVTEGAIRAAHRAMGLEVDDPATTWWGARFAVSGPRRHEDMVSNGPHLALIIATLLALSASPALRTPDRLVYAGVLAVAFLLFCALLRWQPWHSRLQLPLFVLWAPLIGIALDRRPRLAGAAAALLLLGAAVIAVAGEPRPLLGVLRESRTSQYFRARPDLHGPYVEVVQRLAERRCARIGLRLGGDDWEYPLWVLARHAIPGARLEHLDLAGPGGRSGPEGGDRSWPCGLVATGALAGAESAVVGEGTVYRRELSAGGVALFLQSAGGSPR
jgi:hypothetical protein